MPIPLAARIRPQYLEQMVGQDHLLAEGAPLQRLLLQGRVPSCLLWGPPGSGKTTLASLMGSYTQQAVVRLSAVSAGVKDVRAVVHTAQTRANESQQGTLLFLDEIHRFSKAQQDILLPFVEDGTLTLVGATTENPAYEVNAALRSRLQLYILEPLDDAALQQLIDYACNHPEGLPTLELSHNAKTMLIAWAGGDGRQLLNGLETLSKLPQPIKASQVAQTLGDTLPAFDKGGDDFYQLISALHKSVRGCQPDAALYWLARMLVGGADPIYIARRLVRIASEDIGLADPNALRLAIAARDAFNLLGKPEGELALAQLTVYLAVAPKSNAVYRAWQAAQDDATRLPRAPVPLPLRNAPRSMLRELGYSEGYRYYFDDPVASFQQDYVPEGLATPYYHADGEGWEPKVQQRLAHFASLRTPPTNKADDEDIAT